MSPLELSRFGFSVMPCRRGTGTDADKQPLLGEWKPLQSRRATEEEILGWIEYYGDTNWAIITGATSGVVVLDIDSQEGERAAEAMGLPETVVVSTAHGRHLYFRHPGHLVPNWAKRLPGMDFRGDGGYVIAPGSVHPTGVVYEWIESIEDVELAEMPAWLLDICTSKARSPAPVSMPPRTGAAGDTTSYVSAALAAEIDRLRDTPKGARNAILNEVAFKLGTLIGAGRLERGIVEAQLLGAAESIGLVGDEYAKTIDTMNRAIRDGAGKPRDMTHVRGTLPDVELIIRNGNGSAHGTAHRHTVHDDAATGTTRATPTTSSDPETDPETEPETFEPDWGNEPLRTEPILTLDGSRIGSRGNLTVIVAAPGIGKSSVCEAVVSKRLNNDCDALGLGVVTDRPVVYIDTERSREDHWMSWFRMTRRARHPHGEPVGPEIGYTLFALVPSIQRRRELLAGIIGRDPGLLVIDGIGDFVTDVNDAEDCNAFLHWLMAEAKRRDFAVLTTIHHNPQAGSEKARGHLGSEAMRRAESVLILKRDLATGSRTLTTNFEHGKVRSDRDLCETHFGWSEADSMFVRVDAGIISPRRNRSGDDLREVILAAYGERQGLTYTELWHALAEHRSCSERQAKRLASQAESVGFVTKDDRGTWLIRRDLIEP